MNFKTIPCAEVIVPEDRQRQEFDPVAMQELQNSIEDRCLMHAIVLREEEGKLVLVAGERRLRAVMELDALGKRFHYAGELVPEGHIPYVGVGELTELEAEELELDENLRRRDLTWQEHAAAVERLHKLRQKQASQKMMNDLQEKGVTVTEAAATAAASGGHTVADTALELHGRKDGSYQEQVRQELIVARHLNNPVIAKAKNVQEAMKLLKAEEQRKRNVELGKAVGASFNASKHTLLQGDCVDLLLDGKWEGYFDVLLTDPPYGMGADSFGDGGGKLMGIEHEYNDSYEEWQNLMRKFVPLSYAVTKPQAHAYIFCDIDRFHELKGMMQAVGWYVFRTPFICVKPGSGRVPRPEHGPRRQYEIILYAIKGDKQVTHIYPDVISTTADEQLGHGAQKPVALYQNLLQRSVRPGDKVLDCFGGTGTLLEAAHGMQCEAVVMEKVPSSYGICVKRLQQLRDSEELGLFGAGAGAGEDNNSSEV